MLPAWRDLWVIALILIVVDAIAGAYLVYVYLPARREEVSRKAPAQLSVLARDRQNALSSWVRERIADAEIAASFLAKEKRDGAVPADAPELLDRFNRAYEYESTLLVEQSGSILLRRGSNETDDRSVVQFAQSVLNEPRGRIDFCRIANGRPKILSACAFTSPGNARAVVVFVSDPYAYVYPLFSTFGVGSRTGETNLIGLYGGWGVALNPYPEGSPPPMTLRLPIPPNYAAQILASGERAVRYIDRRGMPVIAIAKAIPLTPWVVVVKIDEEEVLAGAVAETVRFGELLASISFMLAGAAFIILRSRRVRDLRIAEDQLARLFENSTTGIVVLQVIWDPAGTPSDHEVVDMNPAAERFLGVSAAEEVGKRSADAAYLQWSDEVRANNYRVALEGISIQYERFRPEPERWYETRVFSPRYGQFAQLLTDITRRKKSEETVRSLSARLLRVQDETRRRIARELHETTAQSLAAIRMNLGMIQRSTGSEERVAEFVDESLAITDDAIREIRTLSYLLHPPMIEQAGLFTTLRWYVDGFQQRSGIATMLRLPEDLERLAPDLETSVFRIIQESLTNIQRHSGSATASVSISHSPDRLCVEVADQGHGLPPRVRDDLDALLASGVGVAGINERVHELRGEMNIRSSESGTTLMVTVPVE